MKKTILFGIFIFILFVSGCAQEQIQGALISEQSFNGSYKIGVMLALTGDAATYGLPEQKVIKIAVDEINSKGGINGKKLIAVYEDGKCNPKDGNAAAQKLINVDKVKVIIGGSCSGETLGAAPIAESNKVLIISPSSTSPDITNAGDFIFRVAPSDAKAGIVASDYAYNSLKARKAALITELADYPQGLRRVFKENFINFGGKIVADETYNPEDTDFRTQATKVKSSNPDIVYIVPQAPPKGILLLKQMKETGINKQILTAEVLIGRDVIKENTLLADGLIGVEQKFDDNNPKATALFAKYRQQTKQEPPFPTYMAGAYDIVYLMADGIRKHGYNGENLRNYLYSVKNYQGAIGNLTLDTYGDPIMDFDVKQVKNGQLSLVK